MPSIFNVSKRPNYQKYFSLEYLISYGYFDHLKPKFYKRDEYFSSRIFYSKIFTMEHALKPILKFINTSQIDGLKQKDTIPVLYEIYKNDNERRVLKFPNLFSYCLLVKHLSDEKTRYIEVLKSSNKSLSNKFDDSTFNEGQKIRDSNRFGRRKVFQTDIQHFYPSIYTHSIPWLLAGKDNAKQNKTNDTVYYNALDKLIQKCQWGETHGIPTGTLPARIIAELFMCKIDEELQEYNYVRYVDDFELAYNNINEQQIFYRNLVKLLSNVNLKIKTEKNVFRTFPFAHNDIDFFENFFSNAYNKEKSVKLINTFINESVNKESEGRKGSIKLMFRFLISAVESKKITEKELNKEMIKKLLNLVLMMPSLMVYFLELVDMFDRKNIQKNIQKAFEEIQFELEKFIEDYLDNIHHQEVMALLSIIYYVEAHSSINGNLLLKIIKYGDDFSSALAVNLLLQKENFYFSNVLEAAEAKMESNIEWEKAHWFLKYHIQALIQSDKNYNKLYKDYIFTKYREHQDKGKFFNAKNIVKIASPLNIKYIEKNSGDDIVKFYQNLLSNNVFFINRFD